MENEKNLCGHLTGIGIDNREDVCGLGVDTFPVPNKGKVTKITIPQDSFFSGGLHFRDVEARLCTASNDSSDQLGCNCFIWKDDETREHWQAQRRSEFEEG